MKLELTSCLLEIPRESSDSDSDWLFITQSNVLQADRLILANNEKASHMINALKFIRCFVGLVIYTMHNNLMIVIATDYSA